MSEHQNQRISWKENPRIDFKPSLDFAKQLDSKDHLGQFKEQFTIPQNTYYLNGNSLGLCSQAAESALEQVKNEWKNLAIRGWFQADTPWFWYSEHLSEQYAPLVGAYPAEVAVTGSTTSNIHNLIATFYQPNLQSGKTKIIMEEPCFPTDIYAVKSQIHLKGLDPQNDLIIVPSDENGNINENRLIEQLKDNKNEICLAFFSSVLFSSGQKLDLEVITKTAQENDITVGFDLSHSVGVVPHELHKWKVDFAVWCSYKWVSAGPGSTAALFVHSRHLPIKPAFSGWWGHKKETQFDMNPDYTPAPGAGAFQLGTIDMLSAAPIKGALEVINKADIENIRNKSIAMTSYFIYLTDYYLENLGIEIITPRDSSQRGGHISLVHPESYRINKSLEASGVIGDFRSPNIIRLAPSPIYNSFQDIYYVVQILQKILKTKDYLNYNQEKDSVS